MELLKKTVELRADSEEESKNIIESYRKDAEEKGHTMTAAGYTYKTKKSKGEIIGDGYLIKIVETYAGFWDDL